MVSRKKESSRPSASSVGQRMIAGLQELETALRHREPIARRFTVRCVELNLEPQDYPAEAIRQVRDLIQVSQAVFAELLGVSVYAVRSWEQGKRVPPKIARRLMDEIRVNPQRWIQMLHQACESSSEPSN